MPQARGTHPGRRGGRAGAGRGGGHGSDSALPSRHWRAWGEFILGRRRAGSRQGREGRQGRKAMAAGARGAGGGLEGSALAVPWAGGWRGKARAKGVKGAPRDASPEDSCPACGRNHGSSQRAKGPLNTSVGQRPTLRMEMERAPKARTIGGQGCHVHRMNRAFSPYFAFLLRPGALPQAGMTARRWRSGMAARRWRSGMAAPRWRS